MPFKNPHPLYSIWQGMKQRCENQNFRQWRDYGGRGIRVCDRWRASFQDFIADMGPRPHGHLLDRIDNDGNYEPTNCRWANKHQSQLNRRVTRRIVVDGREYVAADLADIACVKTDTILNRAALGLSYAEIVSPKPRVSTAGLALGGKASGAKKLARTHCGRGHALTPENVFITPEGWRRCKPCRLVGVRRSFG